jgi:glycerol-3-phosphate dehydrogenase (NAD(P)+)
VSAIAVLGGGAWGTALASHLSRCGHTVRLWVRHPAQAEVLGRSRMIPAYLPGISLPESVEVSSDLPGVVADAPTVMVAIPSAACRSVYAAVRPHLRPGAVLVSATKGLEQESLRRMTEVAAEEAAGHPLAALSGPSFALEVAQGQPTAVVVAAADLAVAEQVQHAVSSHTFRAYSSEDVVGVELAGALKNVIAIAAGIVTGLGYGQNTVAALVTRGLAEITRLAVGLGGRGDTLSGLAGLGDLVLTCTGALSRNRQVGLALGAGRTLSEALAATPMVAEGVWTTAAACALADRAGVEMPIARRMRAVLHQGQAPREAVEQLMLRSLKRE